LARKAERDHFGVLSKQGVDSSLEITDAFAVNDSDFKNAFLLARSEICEHDLFDLARRKRMQVQSTIDRQLHRLVELVIGLFHGNTRDQLTSGAR
jgi:hypothetical protein